MGKIYDVAIIGAGPAGMCAANTLKGLNVIMFEAGPHRKRRRTDNLTSGLGGAGTFSDGKLTLPNLNYPNSFNVGGQLASIVGKERFLRLVEYVKQIYVNFGGHSEIYEKDEKRIEELVKRAFAFGLRITPTKSIHLGSDLAPKIVENLKEDLEKKGVEILVETPVTSVTKEGSGRFTVEAEGKHKGIYEARYVIAAPGRVGASWLTSQVANLGFEIQPRKASIDVGIRVEVPEHVFRPVTELLYDPKIEYYTRFFEDRVRTFCVCPFGEVVVEKYKDLLTTVNGHSLHEIRFSGNTNFALLVSMNLSKPFQEPLEYVGHISELGNMLAKKGQVLVQRLGDLKSGRRSTPRRIARGFVEPTLERATPGDLSLAIPYRQLTNVLEILPVLDNIAPGVNGDDTLLYGVEVKFYSSRIKTSPELEATENFFVAGDGAGITRGLIQSSASGVAVAQTIVEREKS